MIERAWGLGRPNDSIAPAARGEISSCRSFGETSRQAAREARRPVSARRRPALIKTKRASPEGEARETVGAPAGDPIAQKVYRIVRRNIRSSGRNSAVSPTVVMISSEFVTL